MSRVPKPWQATMTDLSPSTRLFIVDKGAASFVRGTAAFTLSKSELDNLVGALARRDALRVGDPGPIHIREAE